LAGIDLLILGSPTHGGQYTQPVKDFLARIPIQGLKNVHAAAFDTGSTTENQGGFGKTMINLFGYAAPRIAKELTKKGAALLGAETFYVLGTEGPLKEGEIERAQACARSWAQAAPWR
jgi:hypothetical protein